MRISDWSSDVCSSDLYDGAFQGVDISAIPLAALDRLEIVADGASALYGSDAVGGVANIILRRDFDGIRSEEHTSELQSLMRISYAVFCLKKKKKKKNVN